MPMQLQVGDRFADETGEWEVISRPYTTAGGKTASARKVSGRGSSSQPARRPEERPGGELEARLYYCFPDTVDPRGPKGK